MRDELEIDEIEDQLRLYCHWLRGRSEVGISSEMAPSNKRDSNDALQTSLAPDAVSEGPAMLLSGAGDPEPTVTVLVAKDGIEPSEMLRGPWRFLALASFVMVAVVGVAIYSLTGGDAPEGTTTVANEVNQSEDDNIVAANEASENSADATLDVGPTGQASTEEKDPNDASTEVSGTEGARVGQSTADDLGGSGSAESANNDGANNDRATNDSATNESTENDDGVAKDGANAENTTSGDGSAEGTDKTTTSEVEENPTATTATPQDSSGTTTTTNEPDVITRTVAFLSPRSGASVDANLGTRFSVGAVDGASTYTFTGIQAGSVVFELAVNEPSFQMPGRLAALREYGWTYESGSITVTVVAHDVTGEELGSSSIQVLMRSGGLTPRFGSSVPDPASETSGP